MKIVTSVTVFPDAVGMRMSATYSEIDEETGRIISDNRRFDRVITDSTMKDYAAKLIEYAAGNLPTKEG